LQLDPKESTVETLAYAMTDGGIEERRVAVPYEELPLADRSQVDRVLRDLNLRGTIVLGGVESEPKEAAAVTFYAPTKWSLWPKSHGVFQGHVDLRRGPENAVSPEVSWVSAHLDIAFYVQKPPFFDDARIWIVIGGVLLAIWMGGPAWVKLLRGP
jgi:hypothetical protein